MTRAAVVSAGVAALLVVSGAVATATSLYREVELNVDGQVTTVGGFGATVADVLSANGIELGARDLVYPTTDSVVADGSTVTVQYAKPVTVTLDGSPVTFFTTATDLDTALDEVALDGIAESRLSLSRSTSLTRAGIELTATTPKEVRLVVGGKSQTVTTLAASVAELLSEQGLSLDGDDRIKPAESTAVSGGMKVRLDRVEVTTKAVTEEIAFKTKKVKDDTLWRGESRTEVTGKPGSAKRTYRITTINGKETKREKIAEKVLSKAVNEVRREGTKVSANGVGLNLARAAMWDRIAKCESGNRWNINTGNGYYGGLQFNLASWQANGGRDFAAYPHQASREEQITVANRYYAKAGTSPWSCA